MLVLSLLAMVGGVALLFLDYSQYPDGKPPAAPQFKAGGVPAGARPAQRLGRWCGRGREPQEPEVARGGCRQGPRAARVRWRRRGGAPGRSRRGRRGRGHGRWCGGHDGRRSVTNRRDGPKSNLKRTARRDASRRAVAFFQPCRLYTEMGSF